MSQKIEKPILSGQRIKTRKRAEVVSEDVILKWYKEGHSVKGKMLFLDQMKKFVEWLQNAEEESESGEEED
ncbi:Basic leucine zipper and W2 domain-containing protein 2 [Acromyrmex echinatior]|uniref:Basic leucine zipper and W2 domain-containing protein 2 n=1 Tax=Acromyrmex echinatior TaxID=103372 RepID=F4WS26_ACREC|nr:Basic leucine zipper and W2 domain-containing protein 2 [Acromyrmex echinatior]